MAQLAGNENIIRCKRVPNRHARYTKAISNGNEISGSHDRVGSEPTIGFEIQFQDVKELRCARHVLDSGQNLSANQCIKVLLDGLIVRPGRSVERPGPEQVEAHGAAVPISRAFYERVIRVPILITRCVRKILHTVASETKLAHKIPALLDVAPEVEKMFDFLVAPSGLVAVRAMDIGKLVGPGRSDPGVTKQGETLVEKSRSWASSTSALLLLPEIADAGIDHAKADDDQRHRKFGSGVA